MAEDPDYIADWPEWIECAPDAAEEKPYRHPVDWLLASLAGQLDECSEHVFNAGRLRIALSQHPHSRIHMRSAEKTIHECRHVAAAHLADLHVDEQLATASPALRSLPEIVDCAEAHIQATLSGEPSELAVWQSIRHWQDELYDKRSVHRDERLGGQLPELRANLRRRFIEGRLEPVCSNTSPSRPNIEAAYETAGDCLNRLHSVMQLEHRHAVFVGLPIEEQRTQVPPAGRLLCWVREANETLTAAIGSIVPLRLFLDEARVGLSELDYGDGETTAHGIAFARLRHIRETIEDVSREPSESTHEFLQAVYEAISRADRPKCDRATIDDQQLANHLNRERAAALNDLSGKDPVLETFRDDGDGLVKFRHNGDGPWLTTRYTLNDFMKPALGSNTPVESTLGRWHKDGCTHLEDGRAIRRTENPDGDLVLHEDDLRAIRDRLLERLTG